MNKSEFMKILKENLKNMPQSELNEIMYDHEEHFNVGLDRGKSEEEIVKELGDPIKLSKSYKAMSDIEKAKTEPSPVNISKAVLATIALGFFNLVFILGPFLGLVGTLIGLYGAAIGVIVAGIGVMIAPILPNYISFGDFINMNGFASFFIGLGITLLGILFTVLNVYITKLFYRLTVTYLKWNINIIKK